jgi:hypothetical protein
MEIWVSYMVFFEGRISSRAIPNTPESEALFLVFYYLVVHMEYWGRPVEFSRHFGLHNWKPAMEGTLYDVC